MTFKFPYHSCGLYLTHNMHKDYYENVEEAIKSETYPGNDSNSWVSPEQRQKAVETNEVWELQWYPDTPIGSYKLLAADLDILLEAASDKRYSKDSGNE